MKKTLIAIFCLLTIASCATITSDSPYEVSVKGEKGYFVSYGSSDYALPTVIKVKPSNTKLTFSKDCYETRTTELDKTFRAGATIFGNILWLAPGVLIDFLTGEMWKIDNTEINAPKLRQLSNCKA
jgi:hypothetical protein